MLQNNEINYNLIPLISIGSCQAMKQIFFQKDEIRQKTTKNPLTTKTTRLEGEEIVEYSFQKDYLVAINYYLVVIKDYLVVILRY